MEDRILGLFVAAQLGADAGQEHRELEGLGHVVVGAGLEPQDGVGVGRGCGQHDHRGADPRLADQPARLAPVHVGQVDIQQDQVRLELARLAHGFAGRRRLGGAELLVQEQLFGERAPEFGIVVDDEDGLVLSHG